MNTINYYGFDKGDLKIETNYIIGEPAWSDYRDHAVKVTHIPSGKFYEATGVCNITQTTLLQECLDSLCLVVE